MVDIPECCFLECLTFYFPDARLWRISMLQKFATFSISGVLVILYKQDLCSDVV
jgi:hypothetical protein